MELKAKNISKKFPRLRDGANFFYALNETEFSIEGGTLAVITGRSGGGKTTLLNILGGLLQPSSGTVTVDGADLYQMNDKKLSAFRNRHIAVIPQGVSAVYTLTVLENVLLPKLMYGKRTDENVGRAEELLRKFGIEDLRDAMPSELSGGELRRMAIARAMITQYGMSEKFGLMGLASAQNQYLDGRTVLNCGDQTATEIDHEVMALLKRSYEEALRLLRAHRHTMDRIAEYLISKETITGKEFMAIFRECEGETSAEASPAAPAPDAASHDAQSVMSAPAQDTAPDPVPDPASLFPDDEMDIIRPV